MVITYLGLVEVGKRIFFSHQPVGTPLAVPSPRHVRRIHRLAAAWSRAR